MLPSFIIIGAQKSASTLLHRRLADHPDVYMPEQEVPFFQDPYYWSGGIAALSSLFGAAQSGQLLGIKRPDYLGRPECPPRIRDHIPEARLLVTLRNPVDRAVSAYFHYMLEGWIPVRPLEEGMREVLAGDYERAWPRSREIIGFGYYHEHIARYREYFAPGQMLILIQEDLVKDVSTALETVYSFLHLESRQSGNAPQDQREKAGVYSVPRLRLLQATRPITRRYNAERTRSWPRTWFPSRVVLGIDHHVLSRVFPDARPQLSAELGSRLHELYRADTDKLEELLGRDLSSWSAKTS